MNFIFYTISVTLIIDFVRRQVSGPRNTRMRKSVTPFQKQATAG
jgi:hypothetical protein